MSQMVSMIDIEDAHNVECSFYDAVKDVDGFPLPKIWYTRCAGGEEPGVILMEDLSAVGGKTGFTLTMSVQQVRRNVARFSTFCRSLTMYALTQWTQLSSATSRVISPRFTPFTSAPTMTNARNSTLSRRGARCFRTTTKRCSKR